MKFGLKLVHMAPYEHILRLVGAPWLRSILKPLLTQTWPIKIQKITQKSAKSKNLLELAKLSPKTFPLPSHPEFRCAASSPCCDQPSQILLPQSSQAACEQPGPGQISGNSEPGYLEFWDQKIKKIIIILKSKSILPKMSARSGLVGEK